MRSPRGGRFPALGLVLFLALSPAPSCTSEDGGSRTEVAASRSPATGAGTESAEGPAEDGDGSGSRSDVSTRIRDKGSRRTVTGTAPSYVEIESVEVTGGPESLSLAMALRGPVPERMPDNDSVLRVSFRVKTKTGPTFMFDAQCVRAGWGTFATGGPEDYPVPALDIAADGSSITLQVDPAYMGGFKPFEWIATVTWSGSGGDYAFDVAPSSGLAGYP